MEFRITKTIQQRNGFHFFIIEKEVVLQFPKQRKTRFVCTINDELSYQCGLNHSGDGNFLVTLSKARLAVINKHAGDEITIVLIEDPNPLGVDMPEVLEVLLDQDEELKTIFNNISDGKKRNLIFTLQNIKNIDKQVHLSIDFLKAQA